MKLKNFKKKNIFFYSKKNNKKCKSHFMLPTPLKLKNNLFRIFYASRDKNNISNIFFTDLEFTNENKIVIKKISTKPSLKNGKLGAFDDNGVLPSSIIKSGKKIYLFYIGWKPGGTTRYSLIAGLAYSNNLGKKFTRVSNSQLLHTNNYEPYSILTAPSVLKIKKNMYYMWYVSCIKWKNKNLPKYNIKFAYSKNLKNWKQTGKVCIKLKKNERAVAKPFVLREKKIFKMWYCYEEKVGNYKIGYAESTNGISWKRKDKLINFNKKIKAIDDKMMEYPTIISAHQQQYILYNGNNYGENGFCIAKLIIKS
jgi:hypothetical protein